MIAKVLLVMYLVNVAARPGMKSAKKLQFHAAVVVEELLTATGGHPCCVVFFTDGSTSSFLVTKAWSQGRGATVFQIDTTGQKNNVTHHLNLVRLARQVRLSSWCTVVVVVSHDPAFLAAFAEWSLRGRLLVWSTRLVVVTRLNLPHLQDLLPAHWTFAMMNTLVLNLEGDDSHLKCVGYTHLPYSPSGAKVEQVAVWTPERGLRLHKDPYPFTEKYNNFYGKEVLVTIYGPFMPYWGGEQRFAGYTSLTSTLEGSDYQLLMTVAEELNFTFRFMPTDSWEDATQKVAERKALTCPLHHILMVVRAEKYDYTFTYNYAHMSFITAMPGPKPLWQSLYYPLAHQVWLAVLAALILVPLVYRAITYVQVRKRDGNTGVTALFQDMTGMLLGQNLPRRLPSTSSSRVLVGSWLVFALIVGLAYRGNLIASLTVTKYPPRPETVSQLVDAVDSITIAGWGVSHRKYYMESKSPLFNAVGRLMDVGPNVHEGLTAALKSPQAHLVGRIAGIYQIARFFTAADGSSRLYVVREIIYPGPSGWPIPHDAPYKAQLNRLIMAAVETGLYQKWMADLITRSKLMSQRRERRRKEGLKESILTGEVRGASALTISHTQGAFILLKLGTCMAVVAFIEEFLSFRFSIPEFILGCRR